MIYLAIAVTDNPSAKKESLRYQRYFENKGEEVFNPATSFDNYKNEYEIMMECYRILYEKIKPSENGKLIMLPNSKQSLGVSSEIAFCRKFDIPVYYVKDCFGKRKILKLEFNTINQTRRQIVELIRADLGYTIKEFYYKRQIEFLQVRNILMHLLRSENLTSKTIGELFDKDHSTVLHSCEITENYLKYDKFFRSEYQNIKQKYENIKYQFLQTYIINGVA